MSQDLGTGPQKALPVTEKGNTVSCPLLLGKTEAWFIWASGCGDQPGRGGDVTQSHVQPVRSCLSSQRSPTPHSGRPSSPKATLAPPGNWGPLGSSLRSRAGVPGPQDTRACVSRSIGGTGPPQLCVPWTLRPLPGPTNQQSQPRHRDRAMTTHGLGMGAIQLL